MHIPEAARARRQEMQERWFKLVILILVFVFRTELVRATMGAFAREIGEGGKRRSMMDTYAGTNTSASNWFFWKIWWEDKRRVKPNVGDAR